MKPKTKTNKPMPFEGKSKRLGVSSYESGGLHADDEFEPGQGVSLYNYTLQAQNDRIFHADANDISFLDFIESEIEARIKITKREIFNIGELLFEAKKVCRKHNVSFQRWIGDKFDFSYETANNFMNVFKYCFAYRRFAEQIPTSILYKISQPSFPDELRDYLFTKGNIETITNGQLKQIVRKYHDEGMEAIEGDIDYIKDAQYTRKQIGYSLDLIKSAIHSLHKAKTQVEQQGNDHLEVSENALTDTAKEINGMIHDVIERSLSDIESVYEECESIVKTYEAQVKEKM
jgi:hypothetical protein